MKKLGILLACVLVVSFAFDAHLETKVLSVTRKGHQAEYLAMSGITIAGMLMDKQGSVNGGEAPEAVSDDRWYQPALLLKRGKPVLGLVEKLGEGYIRLDIEPEPGRRDVNTLSDDAWERVLQVGGVPEELWPTLIDSFQDWIGPDNVPPRTNGAKTDDYYNTLTPPYRIRGGPVDTVRELLLVKGFHETILSGGVLNPDAPPEQVARAAGVIRATAHEALEELRIDVLVPVLAHAAPSADEAHHAAQNRKRIRLERHASRGIAPENRDRRRRANGQAVLAADTAGLILGLNMRNVCVGLFDDLCNAVAHALAAPRAFGFIHNKLNHLCPPLLVMPTRRIGNRPVDKIANGTAFCEAQITERPIFKGRQQASRHTGASEGGDAGPLGTRG